MRRLTLLLILSLALSACTSPKPDSGAATWDSARWDSATWNR